MDDMLVKSQASVTTLATSVKPLQPFESFK